MISNIWYKSLIIYSYLFLDNSIVRSFPSTSIIVGDIGGTYTRLSIIEMGQPWSSTMRSSEKYINSHYKSFEEIISLFLEKSGAYHGNYVIYGEPVFLTFPFLTFSIYYSHSFIEIFELYVVFLYVNLFLYEYL